MSLNKDAESGAEGLQRVMQPGGCRPGDLSLSLVLVVDPYELLDLLLDLLGVLVRRAEQQLLQVAEQVLPGLPGYMMVRRRKVLGGAINEYYQAA